MRDQHAYTELMSIAKTSIHDRCKRGFLFFYTLLLGDETDIFFIPRSVIFFRDTQRSFHASSIPVVSSGNSAV